MISTIPPPRPVSVNSVARTPVATAATPVQKTVRSTPSTEVPLDCHTPSSQPTPTGSPGYSCPIPTNLPLCSYTPKASVRAEAQFVNLPIEIHEAILDHLFGERVSTLTTKGSAQCWNKALRHPRRKALANLSLIAQVWTPLVQSRIYRHIKLKGTTDGLAESAEWFSAHPHLAGYVRHIEFWVPIWGKRANRLFPRQPPGRRPDAGNLDDTLAALWGQADIYPGNDIHYYCSTDNATLEEIFLHVQIFFSTARVLTLEGGHCKNPPMIRHFRQESKGLFGRQRLPVLPNIRIFVMRGAWNLIRDWGHWYHLSQALPALREWHCAYAQPRPEAYFTVSQILVRPPPSVRHLNLSLDGFYKEKDSAHPLFSPRPRFPPICQLLGQIAPSLESLAFTGRLCVSFFDALQLSSSSLSQLNSLDIVARACCRGSEPTNSPPPVLGEELSGITNMNFIHAFEEMVLGALQALKKLPGLDYIRIRFIDLDSTWPLLNPYFQLIHNECAGLWSCEILEALRDSRPSAQFVELEDGIYPQYGPNQQLMGAVYPNSRPRSIQVSTYKIIADASKS